MVKLVAESLEENRYQRLNEELNYVSEGLLGNFVGKLKEAFASLASKYQKLDKANEAAVRQFALEVTTATYVSDKIETGLKLLKAWSQKASLENLVKFLDKAAADKFYGRTKVLYTNKILNVNWIKMDAANLENIFASGGTGGKTAMGGV
ncbi:MAG: hypothetical protein PHF86_00855 [Candidatus Nanoarchaeia archaeon]|jgi:hypothetical protein|nr:hypothetical protein [Candidatus Nanoarchaeia archaeon]